MHPSDRILQNLTVLAVNNGSDTWSELLELCAALDFDVTELPVEELRPDSADGYGLALLSGGYWYDDESRQREAYAAELELIRSTSTPVFGVCLGMQLMHVAFSGDVPLLDEPQNGRTYIELTAAGKRVLALPSRLEVFKNHTRGIFADQVDGSLEVLAMASSRAEVIRHRQRPLLGVQFHPEIMDEPERSRLFEALVLATLKRQP